MTSLSDDEILREMAASALADVVADGGRHVDVGPRAVVLRMMLSLDRLADKEAVAACLACTVYYGHRAGYDATDMAAAVEQMWPALSASDKTEG